MRSNPRILGVAGGGLTNPTWARNTAAAAVGKRGEERTAALLAPYAAPTDGVTVLHDLRIPIPGFSANIDHVVVAGDKVYPLDSKVWKPGFYWTMAGKTRRGWSRFEHAETRIAAAITSSLTAHLGPTADIQTPVFVIWPSSARTALRIGALRIPESKSLTGEAFEKYASSRFGPHGLRRRGPGSNPELVRGLAQLLTGQPQRQPRAAHYGLRPTGTDSFDF